MSAPSYCLCIHATRGCGKDTLVTRLRALNPRIRRFSFADALRDDLAPFVTLHYDLDVWTSDPVEKELLRPLLIAHGMGKRGQDPDHWIKRAVALVHEQVAVDPSIVPVFSDGRFVNEIACLRAEFGSAFHLINLTREGSPPPTDEEEKHYRQVAAMADFHLHWGGDTAEQQLQHARRVLEWVGLSTTSPIVPTQFSQ